MYRGSLSKQRVGGMCGLPAQQLASVSKQEVLESYRTVASVLLYPSYWAAFCRALMSSSGLPHTNISTSSGRSNCKHQTIKHKWYTIQKKTAAAMFVFPHQCSTQHQLFTHVCGCNLQLSGWWVVSSFITISWRGFCFVKYPLWFVFRLKVA